MATYTMSLSSAQATGTFVREGHFGSNALHDVNIDSTGSFQPHEGFAEAVEQLGIRHLRYPGGHAENTLDVTRLENGQLRAEVRAFMDWVVANSPADDPIRVTVVLPTKVDIPAQQIEAFVYELLETYGDYVSGLEIGNEYSIGRREAGFDRSTHPEDIPDSSFVSSMTETEYGIAANRVVNAAQDAIHRLAADHPGLGHDPAILLQLADTNGAGSAYKGNGSWDQANEAILSWLNRDALDAIDGAVAHYYYNKQHTDSLAFEGDYREVRSLDQRIENFNQHLGREVPLYITEWNVLNGNDNQLGMAAASTLLEMFEFMVQVGTEDAFIWPLQHRTGNTIGGNRSATDLDLTPGGGAFQMMSGTLRPETSAETGLAEQFESIDSEWAGGDAVEINYFASQYHDVLYVSHRDLATGTVNLSISDFLQDAVSVEVTRMTMDRSTSDGLSDLADDNGLNRLGRRPIDAEELAILQDLAFFDGTNKNHVKTSGGNYLTYLPEASGIVALTANPTSINDYYFATEVDVEPLFVPLTGNFLQTGNVRLDMLPYDIAEIVIEKAWVQEGGAGSERFIGGLGRDVVLARDGNDTIRTGEGSDTLKGGYGDDLMYAGSGDDSLNSGEGNDTLFAGDGDDLIQVEAGIKEVHGGAGIDTLRLDLARNAYSASLEGAALRLRGDNFTALVDGVETLRFADGSISMTDFLAQIGNGTTGHIATDDRLTGTGDDDLLDGDAGCDVLLGMSGCDTLLGGEGLDLLIAENRGLYGTDHSAQAYRVYKAALGTEPEAETHQHWTTELASGAMSLVEMAQALAASAPFQDDYSGTSDSRFVTLLYRNVLGRDPGSDLGTWINRLDQGTSRAEMLRDLAESPENQSRTNAELQAFETRNDPTTWADDVFRLYQAIFDRAPDRGGFAHWTKKLPEGADFGEIVSAFMDSPEFQRTYGEANTAEFVTLLYENVLKRQPDSGGMEYWNRALESNWTRVDVVTFYMNSIEFTAKTAPAVKAYMHRLGSDDVLEAGSGDSFLSGGLYADTFVFNSTADGTHTVTDLEPWDRLRFDDFGYSGVSDALAHMTQRGYDVIFEDAGVTVILSNTELDQITNDMLAIL